ncbi:MAG: hypothetical protein K6G65_06010 [Lachnospiraceae bacterium]|nr:hypothetical protein [Lachnospiraceae bacterium]
MKKNIKLQNIFFPLWMLMVVPYAWVILLPINFIWDSIAMICGLFFVNESNKFRYYIKKIWLVWIIGFLSDIICSLPMLGLLYFQDFMKKGSMAEKISEALINNPFANPIACVIAVIMVVIAGILIYVLNLKVTFKKEEKDKAKKISLILAVLTAPYFFVIPSYGFYMFLNKLSFLGGFFG